MLTWGSNVRRSHLWTGLIFHPSFRSKVNMLARPCWPVGGAEIVGVTAPSAISCAPVKSPASTSACPAGVSLPAPLEFHWLIRFASPLTPISRPKEPIPVPVSRSPDWRLVLPASDPSPSLSEGKIAPCIPLAGEGRNRLDGSGLYQWVMKLIDAPYLKSVKAPAENWCLRSSPFGPRRLVSRKLNPLLMKSPSRAMAVSLENA